MIGLRNIGWFAVVLVVTGRGVPAAAADYAPLDCTKTNSEAQRVICTNYGLGQIEARMATLFEVTTALVAMGQRGEIQDDQRIFLKERDACRSNIDCIQNIYDARINRLEAVISHIKERGPF
jgi:uncharacterized protein